MRLDQLLDLDSREHLQFLEHIQGNILKFHGRNQTALVFITLQEEATPAALAWIASEGSTNVTSAKAQVAASISYRSTETDGGIFETLSISPTGYRRLGIPSAEWPSETRYRYGMKAARNTRPGIPFKDIPLFDPPFGEWEDAFRKDLDLLVLLADDNEERLDTSVARILAEAAAFAHSTHVERGKAIYRGEDKIEHFGYVDGISDPVFVKQDVEREVASRSAEKWDPSANLDVVLSPDSQGAKTFGSYLVVRKLEQNVALFNAQLTRLADALSLVTETEQIAGLIVGRRRDGTPIVDHYSPVRASDYPNDFQYDQDPLGMKCPFHAHIRKVNPRGDIHRANSALEPNEDLIAFERRRRIARRGITYGYRPDLMDEALGPPAKGCGLLFMGYGRGIFSFELWQQTAEDESFIRNGTGVDPVIAQNPRPFMQEWPCQEAEEGIRRAPFFGCVRLMGGEYFFTPSMDFMYDLGTAGDRRG